MMTDEERDEKLTRIEIMLATLVERQQGAGLVHDGTARRARRQVRVYR